VTTDQVPLGGLTPVGSPSKPPVDLVYLALAFYSEHIGSAPKPETEEKHD